MAANTTAQWLRMLGTLTAAAGSVAEAEAKLRAYAPLLEREFPSQAFTRESLTHVARACKFFPTFGELCDALSEWWRDNRPPQLAITGQRYGQACESPIPYKLPPPPEWCFKRSIGPASDDDDHTGLPSAAARNAALPPEKRAQPRYLSPEQLDHLAPLPNGQKRYNP